MFIDRLRGLKRELIVRAGQKAETLRQMVKIAFFGTPAFAVPTLKQLLGSPHRVVAAVTQPDRPRGRGRRVSESPVKQAANASGVPVLQPERMKDPVFMAALAALAPTWASSRRTAGCCRTRSCGPAAPGHDQRACLAAAEVPRAPRRSPRVMAGETKPASPSSGSCARWTPARCCGTQTLPIGPEDTSETLDRKLAELGATALMQTVDDLDHDRAVEEGQDHAQATFAPRLTREDGAIDWTRSARALHDQVRGLHPWPRAACRLDGTRYLIHRTAIAARPPASPEYATARPGQVIPARADNSSWRPGRYRAGHSRDSTGGWTPVAGTCIPRGEAGGAGSDLRAHRNDRPGTGRCAPRAPRGA